MMKTLREGHLRVLYSLLKPAVRCAARFHVPVRTVVDLVRLAYFEVLHQQGLSYAEIGERLGQTDRHMRSLAQRLNTDFFAAETEMGLVREIEGILAMRAMTEAELLDAMSAYQAADIRRAVELLLRDERITRGSDDSLRASGRYTVMSTDSFPRRIDALNHCLDATYGAIVHRLLLDDSATAMVKTLSFVAAPSALQKFVKRLEGELRTELGALEEAALFGGADETRFMMNLSLTPADDTDRGKGFPVSSSS